MRAILTDLKYKTELSIINLMIMLFLFRTAVPFFKYPFLVIYAGFWLYKIVESRTGLINGFINFLRDFYVPILVFCITIIAFFFSNKIYLIVFKDISSTLIMLSFFLLIRLVPDSNDKLPYFYTDFLRLIILFGFLSAAFTLFVRFDLFSFQNFAPKNMVTFTKAKDSIDIDNNFALLPVFFGMLSIFYSLAGGISGKRKYIFIVLLSFFTLDILLSASKRGLFSLIILILFFIVAFGLRLVKLRNLTGLILKICKAGYAYFISLVLLVVLSLSFLYLTDYNSKGKALRALGVRNVAAAFDRVTKGVFEYIQVFNPNSSYRGLYTRIWRPEFNPDEPDFGWGTLNHTTVEKLTGNNVEIVPSGAKGYLLDKSCNSESIEGNAYAFTLIEDKISDLSLISGAYVYCYVSDDYDGMYAMMAFEGSEGNYKRSSYDMSRKGTWQKLTLSFDYSKGYVPLYLYIAKQGVPDLSTLQGFVIFAHPAFANISNSGSLLRRPETSEISTASLITIEFSSLTGMLFSYVQDFSPPKDNDLDPLRRLFARFISEDTTYHGLKHVVFHDKVTDNFINIRSVHWKYAWQIYRQEYTYTEKLFGSGFDFLNWFGYYFLDDPTASDWPHNPFLSVLLYSGLIGLIVYIYLLFLVFKSYLNNLKHNSILFLFFLLTFFFSFFSGSGPFDPPMMGFFVLLAFFLESQGKSSKIKIQKNIS